MPLCFSHAFNHINSSLSKLPVPEVRLEEWLYIGVVDDLVQGDFSYLSLKLYGSFYVLILHSIYKSCVDFHLKLMSLPCLKEAIWMVLKKNIEYVLIV